MGDCNGLGCGIIYKLTLSGRGQWTESIIYSFTGGNDGSAAYGGVVFDRVGNLYGTTYSGSTYNCGAVFRLAPSGSGWTESTLHVFNPNAGDGCNPVAGLTIDMVGDLYGTTSNGGVQNGGTVFEVVPQPNGTWTETVLYALSSGLGYAGPSGAVTLDASGNLYGTTYGGGAYGLGAVFKLTGPLAVDGAIPAYTTLADMLMENSQSVMSHSTAAATSTVLHHKVGITVTARFGRSHRNCGVDRSTGIAVVASRPVQPMTARISFGIITCISTSQDYRAFLDRCLYPTAWRETRADYVMRTVYAPSEATDKSVVRENLCPQAEYRGDFSKAPLLLGIFLGRNESITVWQIECHEEVVATRFKSFAIFVPCGVLVPGHQRST